MRSVRRRRSLVVAGVTVLLAMLVVAGCSDTDSQAMGAHPSTTPSIHPLPISDRDDMVESPTDDGPAATFVRNGDQIALPDPGVTPGDVFPDVDVVAVCQPHYIQGIRQPRFNAKVAAFAQYGISIRDRESYAVDHLIPVSLGGTNDEKNLWPQPREPQGGAKQKDQLEQQLRGLVCSGFVPLAEAQHALATDWWSAFGAYMGRPILPGTLGPSTPDTEAEAAPGEVVNGAACPNEGEIGYTQPKRIALTCKRTPTGALQWQKRS